MLKEFSSRLRKAGEHKGAWTYVVMDGRGTIDGESFESSFMAVGDGTHMLPVKASVRRAIGKEAGDEVRVRLEERIA